MTTLWHIWKARNHARFQNKKWSVLQVHYAVAADIKLSSTMDSSNATHPQQDEVAEPISFNNSVIAGRQMRSRNFTQPNQLPPCSSHTAATGNTSSSAGRQLPNGTPISAHPFTGRANLPAPPLYQVIYPILLPGARCYTDAATSPDQTDPHIRKAGLGIFILEPRRGLMIQIKALANAVSSVLMAEAAALTLAGTIISALQIQDIFFLSDSQQMVNFFNGQHHSSPPQWEIKPLTQKFLNTTAATNFRVAKIDRNLNITAHCLATQSQTST
jgi:ribonuclease HI